MKGVLFAGIVVAGLSLASATSVSAATCPAEMQAQNACTAWLQAQELAPLKGVKAQSTEPVVCADMRQREPSALLLYRGQYVTDPDKQGVVTITRFRNTGWKKIGPQEYSKVICLPERWMRQVADFTVCGSVGHYYFNRRETGQFKRQHGGLTSDDIARMWKGG